MKIYHQCGHNFVWNIQSIEQDSIGEGLIISPVNVDADKVGERIPEEILSQSWMDPQFFLPSDAKGHLSSYPFFPANLTGGFDTEDFEGWADSVARQCLDYQVSLGLRYLTIPARYFNDIPDDYLDQAESHFVNPFLKRAGEIGLTQPFLLTIIVKHIQIERGDLRDELLSWITGVSRISGVYLIFDNDFYTKQIKDPSYLANMLRFIGILRANDLEVHVGYTGVEAVLLSAADPTSVTVGSYENLKSFSVQRLQTREKQQMRGPRPRVYSGRLLQAIDDASLPAIRELVPNWTDLFEDSPYKDDLLGEDRRLHFSQPDIYKHYFWVIGTQISALPPLEERVEYLTDCASEAIARFDDIRSSGVLLDGDSDGSHLTGWANALAMYEADPE